MGEEITPQHSIGESDHSRSSEVALIEKFFPEIRSLNSTDRDRKYSRKYHVTANHIEEEKNAFQWTPDKDDFPDLHTRNTHKSDRKISHKHLNSTMSTLESNKTSSSCTASEFASNVYSRNGYIRSNGSKKCSHENNSMLKYNEFSSLMSSLGNGRNFPVEVKLEDKKEEEKQSWLKRENSIFIILGGIHMMLGILMAVFGVLVIAHDSSLSSAGSGLWGGAVAMFSGLIGILAGLKGCYHNKNHSTKISRNLLTIFLALCLVSFALSNLVVVLTATGFIRDVQRPKGLEETTNEKENFVNWPPILADVGLILASALQCVAAVYSGYKCYKIVCPCLGNEHNRLSNADLHEEKFKVEGKEKLVNHWLGQQFRVPTKKGKSEGHDNLVPWGTPNIVLLPPPPPMIANGQIPILTFLQAPSSVFGSSVCGHVYPPSVPCCCRHENRYIPTPHSMMHERRLKKIPYIQPDTKVAVSSRNRSKLKRERRASLPTAEEVAKTYTGLDREIAEEFIAIAMDKGARKPKRNSFAEYTVDSSRNGY